MLRIALTGGLATGKTHALDRFSALGVPTLDADHLVHRHLEPGEPAAEAVAARFGEAVTRPDGGIDRPALAAIVFAKDDARHELEAILHPAVYADIEAWLAAQAAFHPFAIAGIPLLFETRREGLFDRVIVTWCPPDQQIARAMHRDGQDEAVVRRRLAAQMPADEKARRADFVIDTSGSHEETNRQVDEIFRTLAGLSGA